VGCSTTRTQQDNQAKSQMVCIGSEQAANGAVYFHGIDSHQPSVQELLNREKLSALANELDMRIAVPRAQARCLEGSICWGWALNDDEARQALDEVAAAVTACGVPGNNLGVIGFSNGGYLIAKLFRSNMFQDARPQISWGVAVSSAVMRGPIGPVPPKVSGRLVMVVGNSDQYNYDPKQNYFKELQKKSAQVYLFEFIGGHELPLAETRKALYKVLNMQDK